MYTLALPGLYARVRIPVGPPEPTILVSERAIETDQSQKFVLVVGRDRVAAYRAVTLGALGRGQARRPRRAPRRATVVIVNGLQHVRPGMAVDPENAVADVPSGMVVAAR